MAENAVLAWLDTGCTRTLSSLISMTIKIMRAVANESVDIQLLELDIDKTPYTVTKSYQSSFYKRVTFKMLDKEKRRRLTNCGVYFAVLMLGVLIGLVPFLIQYVNETQGKCRK